MKINFMERYIMVTKKFLARASQPGSPEFQQMMQLRKDLPEFPLVMKVVRHNNTHLKGLTYSYMEDVLTSDPAYADELSNFYTLRSAGFSYGQISKWFLSQFPYNRYSAVV